MYWRAEAEEMNAGLTLSHPPPLMCKQAQQLGAQPMQWPMNRSDISAADLLAFGESVCFRVFSVSFVRFLLCFPLGAAYPVACVVCSITRCLFCVGLLSNSKTDFFCFSFGFLSFLLQPAKTSKWRWTLRS